MRRTVRRRPAHLLAGSSNQFITVRSSMLPVAGYQFVLNAPRARVNFVALQADIS